MWVRYYGGSDLRGRSVIETFDNVIPSDIQWSIPASKPSDSDWLVPGTFDEDGYDTETYHKYKPLTFV
jgi:hypothetical protein